MKVFNRKDKDVPDGAVYIGRGSPYGNPYRIGKDGNRDEVISKYETYLRSNPALQALVLSRLKGKNLSCYCSPKPCHGDVLIKFICEKSDG